MRIDVAGAFVVRQESGDGIVERGLAARQALGAPEARFDRAFVLIDGEDSAHDDADDKPDEETDEESEGEVHAVRSVYRET